MDAFEPDPTMAREAIIEIIENQLREETPPETKTTFDRLIAEGHSRDETMKLIGCVLSQEMFEILKHQQTFDEPRYVAALQALPELPSESDG